MKQIIFHIDMDAFFASCEEALNPKLKGKPLIVGGTKKDTRSIVSCPNYLARARGIKTAMPISRALQLAPDGNFIRCTKGLYSDFSKRVMAILNNYTPVIEKASIDEAYLEVSGVMRQYDNNPVKLAAIIKEEIKNELNITCSVGISSVKIVSKIASKQNKPDGITFVPDGQEKEFLANLPVQIIPGVGKSTYPKLAKYGIRTIGDLRKFDKSFYENEIGMYSSYLLEIANGTYIREVHSFEEHGQKSLSKDHTLDFDTGDKKYLEKQLYLVLEMACSRLRKKKYKSKNITVKVKYSDFTINQKSHLTDRYSNIEMDYEKDAKRLLSLLLPKGRSVRLIGVKFTDLITDEDSRQEDLFEDKDKMKNLVVKIDIIRKKFNYDILKFGKTFDGEK
ncbi:MAG: DNA polymerase IV [Ignavibacteria bacterium]|nr:DNA polymerase IV [Ignavibacteria bacterium]